MSVHPRPTFIALAAMLLCVAGPTRADEQLFGYIRGAETLPRGHADLYQFTTLRAGKDSGTYRGWDFETEAEYGFTDQLQGSLAVTNHYFDVRGVPELDDGRNYRVGGLEAAMKYRLRSPFKDGYGLALRPEVAFIRYDDVGGLLEHELLAGAALIYQHNFIDDTLVLAANGGFDFTWGKQPAEAYDHELLLDGLLGLSYRFAANWSAGVETRIHSEFPNFDFGTREHTIVFAGPALHYAVRRWWATLSWAYQLWGDEVDGVVPHKAYAEETRNEYRLKLGLNF